MPSTDLIRLYLQEIGRIRLLRPDEEIELARKIAEARAQGLPVDLSGRRERKSFESLPVARHHGGREPRGKPLRELCIGDAGRLLPEHDCGADIVLAVRRGIGERDTVDDRGMQSQFVFDLKG